MDPLHREIKIIHIENKIRTSILLVLASANLFFISAIVAEFWGRDDLLFGILGIIALFGSILGFISGILDYADLCDEREKLKAHNKTYEFEGLKYELWKRHMLGDIDDNGYKDRLHKLQTYYGIYKVKKKKLKRVEHLSKMEE